MICEECSSHGEGGTIEYSDGKAYHFRKPWPKDGTIRPIMCSGKFVEDKVPVSLLPNTGGDK